MFFLAGQQQFLIFGKHKVIDGRIDGYDRMRIDGIFRA